MINAWAGKKVRLGKAAGTTTVAIDGDEVPASLLALRVNV